MQDLLIFDLDGTLIDSKRDLTDSVNATRTSHGLAPLPDDIVSSYVGNGAPLLIRRAFPHATQEELPLLLRYFLDYYREHMLDATTLYPGVRQALDRLHEADVPLAVLTNKPVRFSIRLIEGLGLESHFFRVYGGNSFEQKKPDPIGINTLMAEAGSNPDQTVMVGDSAVDIRTARNAGVVACGVSWGFQPETFEQAPPDFLIDDMRTLVDRVLSATE
ncbi:MAG: HAD-IA family hydrolase [Acidobacteriia bacterium]|nr:HAD-IA family hydrolase [Terriglobia bacterium]